MMICLLTWRMHQSTDLLLLLFCRSLISDVDLEERFADVLRQ